MYDSDEEITRLLEEETNLLNAMGEFLRLGLFERNRKQAEEDQRGKRLQQVRRALKNKLRARAKIIKPIIEQKQREAEEAKAVKPKKDKTKGPGPILKM